MTDIIHMEFIRHECITCGCIFYTPKQYDDMMRKNKQSFYCYNGHSQAYVKTTADLLQEKLNEQRRVSDSVIADKNREILTLKSEVYNLKKKDAPKPTRPAKRIKPKVV